MKTIEEKAKEYGLEVSPHSAWTAKNAETSFKSGVEFAQRWIPVEDLDNPAIPFLGKDERGKIELFKTPEIKYLKAIGITHWRKIELL